MLRFHGGRGYRLDEFGDYFRTQRWNQGPGSDQPRLGRNVGKGKVASSIAHLYDRPRVWLEGFYASGWGTTSTEIADATYANMCLGYNLLTLHGLYYTTYGRWWEWAPPCNHFHMPYWQHMDQLLATTERLSYLLSQGRHVADVAVMYPVETVVAYPELNKRTTDMAFNIGNALYSQAIDFDFMDYQSLARASVSLNSLSVSGESYRAVILPNMRAMNHEALLRLKEFSEQGGIVVIVGESPIATDKAGESDEVRQLVAYIAASANTYRLDSHPDVPAATQEEHRLVEVAEGIAGEGVLHGDAEVATVALLQLFRKLEALIFR